MEGGREGGEMEEGREDREERREDTTDHMSATDDVTLTTYLLTPPLHTT